jgi:hypothetical protein
MQPIILIHWAASHHRLSRENRSTAKSGVWYIFRPRRFTILERLMTENMYLTPSP